VATVVVFTTTAEPPGDDMAADLDPSTDTATLGPVDYLVVAFPTDRMTGEAFRILVDLVDRGIVRILDLAFVRKEHDGVVTTLAQQDVERMHLLDAALFDGAASGLLDQSDLAEAAQAMDPGTAAAVLVYENVWATPFAQALGRSGGRLVAYGHIPVQAIVDQLDQLEAAEGGDAGDTGGVIPQQASPGTSPAEPVS
jgi:Family of unknown function (DUF6325)